MYFLNNSFPMEREAISSGVGPKRGHHWLEDASSNKKQACEVFTSEPRFPDVNLSLWDYNSSIQSGVGMYPRRLPEPVKDLNLAAKNISINGASNAGKAKIDQMRDSPKEILSVGHSYSREIDLTLSLGMACNDGAGPMFNKDGGNFMSMGRTISNRDGNLVLMGQNTNKDINSIFPMVQPVDKERGNIILMDRMDNTELGTISSGASAAGSPKTGRAQKNEQKMPKTKKLLSNRFPSNVKALLSTGILDGVPVKYVSWGRDKNLLGIIKGTGYLCGCKDCNFSKAVSAFELEGHAGGKTKHPNNHIYFENGKSIYSAVQEVQKVPLENLFDAVRILTGSPINEENFSTWKASYEAASREIQRIYGMDEVAPPS